ncbi:MAG: translation elongation factor 4, partial [Synergistaceae bacterium]|nr:translation elongation factor 4 [Synergistaceae bacterium]
MTTRQSKIRNFSIIAHIDHGKSTLADRLLEYTKTVESRDMKAQLLDFLDLERERGITIKLVPVRMNYTAQDGEEYVLNLIDTPGHVDFSYEVSRSLAACEGALLIVDATQGVEAQTVANAYLAVDQGLDIIPVINKIDLPSARIDYAKNEISEVIGLDADDAISASAKEGKGVEEILERIVQKIPAPQGNAEAPLEALIFDSLYDNYRGVICYVRVVNGTLRTGQNVLFMATNVVNQVTEVGVFKPGFTPVQSLGPGEVGYITASIKSLADAHVGDTVTDAQKPAAKQLPGYRKVKPVVFCGFYPVERDEYSHLRDSLEKLSLNDSAITYEPETSVALGFGFRCGFLGLLHMDVAKERLRREFDVELVATAPNVSYEITTASGEIIEAHRPSDFPDMG